MKPTIEEIRKAMDFVYYLVGKGLYVDSLQCPQDAGLKDSNIGAIQRKLHENWTYDWGATKYVLLLPELDRWVIKFDRFFNQNFCEIEAENYERAAEKKVEEFFAPTYFLCQIGELKFFLQEKISSDRKHIDSTLEKFIFDSGWLSEEEASDEDEVTSLIDDMDWCDIIDVIFGDNNKIKELFDFIEEIMEKNNMYADIHSGNIGTDSDGNYIIFDFSGFRG